METQNIKERLEYLRGEIEAERISYEEIAELQSLKEHIEEGDTLLLEWAGVPEFDVEKGIKYGDFGAMEDDELNTKREELMDYLEKDKSEEFIEKLHELQEVERELTLRETN